MFNPPDSSIPLLTPAVKESLDQLIRSQKASAPANSFPDPVPRGTQKQVLSFEGMGTPSKSSAGSSNHRSESLLLRTGPPEAKRAMPTGRKTMGARVPFPRFSTSHYPSGSHTVAPTPMASYNPQSRTLTSRPNTQGGSGDGVETPKRNAGKGGDPVRSGRMAVGTISPEIYKIMSNTSAHERDGDSVVTEDEGEQTEDEGSDQEEDYEGDKEKGEDDEDGDPEEDEDEDSTEMEEVHIGRKSIWRRYVVLDSDDNLDEEEDVINDDTSSGKKMEVVIISPRKHAKHDPGAYHVVQDDSYADNSYQSDNEAKVEDTADERNEKPHGRCVPCKWRKMSCKAGNPCGTCETAWKKMGKSWVCRYDETFSRPRGHMPDEYRARAVRKVAKDGKCDSEIDSNSDTEDEVIELPTTMARKSVWGSTRKTKATLANPTDKHNTGDGMHWKVLRKYEVERLKEILNYILVNQLGFKDAAFLYPAKGQNLTFLTPSYALKQGYSIHAPQEFIDMFESGSNIYRWPMNKFKLLGPMLKHGAIIITEADDAAQNLTPFDNTLVDIADDGWSNELGEFKYANVKVQNARAPTKDTKSHNEEVVSENKAENEDGVGNEMATQAHADDGRQESGQENLKEKKNKKSKNYTPAQPQKRKAAPVSSDDDKTFIPRNTRPRTFTTPAATQVTPKNAGQYGITSVRNLIELLVSDRNTYEKLASKPDPVGALARAQVARLQRNINDVKLADYLDTEMQVGESDLREEDKKNILKENLKGCLGVKDWRGQ